MKKKKGVQIHCDGENTFDLSSSIGKPDEIREKAEGLSLFALTRTGVYREAQLEGDVLCVKCPSDNEFRAVEEGYIGQLIARSVKAPSTNPGDHLSSMPQPFA